MNTPCSPAGFSGAFRRLVRCLVVLASPFVGSFLAAATFYVAPTAQGTGNGSSDANAAAYDNLTFWSSTVQAGVDAGNTTVWFRKATYPGTLKLWDIGHPSHVLTLDVNPAGGGTFKMNNSSGYLLSIHGAQNLTIKNFYFTGTAAGTAVLVQGGIANPATPARWVKFDTCTWEDMTSLTFAALNISEMARDVTVTNCRFENIANTSGLHMIYCYRAASNITVSNCTFIDCKGAYVRFRDDVEFAKVDGCTFTSSASVYDQNFIQVPCYNTDVDQANDLWEFMGRNFQITNNSFSWVGSSASRWALVFLNSGFNPYSPSSSVPAPDYAIDATEASTLNTGTVAQKNTLLTADFMLSNTQVHFHSNSFSNAHGQVKILYDQAYGSPGSDSGDCNISNWPGTGSLGAVPAFRNAGFEFDGDPRRCWYTLSAVDFDAPVVDTRPAPHVGLNSTSAVRLRRSQATVFGQCIGNATSDYEVRFLLAIGSPNYGTPPSSVRMKAKFYHNEIKNACLVLAVDSSGQIGYEDASGTFVPVSALGTLSFSSESPSGSGQFPNANWYQFRVRAYYSGGTLKWQVARGVLKTAGDYTYSSGDITSWSGAAPVAGSKLGMVTFENYGRDVIIDTFYGTAL